MKFAVLILLLMALPVRADTNYILKLSLPGSGGFSTVPCINCPFGFGGGSTGITYFAGCALSLSGSTFSLNTNALISTFPILQDDPPITIVNTIANPVIVTNVGVQQIGWTNSSLLNVTNVNQTTINSSNTTTVIVTNITTVNITNITVGGSVSSFSTNSGFATNSGALGGVTSSGFYTNGGFKILVVGGPTVDVANASNITIPPYRPGFVTYNSTTMLTLTNWNQGTTTTVWTNIGVSVTMVVSNNTQIASFCIPLFLIGNNMDCPMMFFIDGNPTGEKWTSASAINAGGGYAFNVHGQMITNLPSGSHTIDVRINNKSTSGQKVWVNHGPSGGANDVAEDTNNCSSSLIVQDL